MKSIDDVKRALNVCTDGVCDLCPYAPLGNCIDDCMADALTLIRQLQYALLLMVSQYCTEDDGTVFHRFMTAGEHAFAVLGITEPMISESDLESMIESLEKEMYPK